LFEFINTVLGVPLGLILRLMYNLTGHFGIAVLIFAVIVRFIMLPVNFLAHRNSIRFLRLQPALYRLKKQFSVDKESLSAAQYELFKEKKYRPLLGLVPLFLQLFLLIGVLQVMYHPLQHVLHWDREAINQAIYGISGFGAQLTYAANLIDMDFLGINLGATPSFAQPILLIVPLLSGLSALAFCLVQTVYSPGALTQSARANWGLTIFTVAFSIYFAWVTPAAVGFYWIIGNILGIGVTWFLEATYGPKKMAMEAYEHIVATRKTKAQLRKERQVKRRLAARQKHDVSAFNRADKGLVFYALTGGQYKYYKNTIDYILENSDIIIHYLTNDPDDKVFEIVNKNLKAYYASERKTISLLLRLDCDIFVTTVQDLQTYHLKRSIARKDIEYIHIPHGPASLHLTAREAAYDHFDTFFCVGPHQANELRQREEMAGLPKKTLVKAGYGLYDQLVQLYAQMPPKTDIRPQILIAPSWQPDNILDICIVPMLSSLLNNGWRIIVRPHPQNIQVFPEIISDLALQYADEIKSGELKIDTDFLSNESIFTSDIIITDWSGIAFEFGFTTLKPAIFINTPMKVLNPNYKDYDLPVLDLVLRDIMGISLDVDDVAGINQIVDKLLADKDIYQNQIEAAAKEYIYHHGRSGEAGGKYIISQISKRP
jgi:YidC/Oxa1 family membrane protein insertase